MLSHPEAIFRLGAATTAYPPKVAQGLPITGDHSPYHQPSEHLGAETADREASLHPYPGTQVRKNRDAPSATVAACSPSSGSSHTSPA
jgi:hypothetical protein